MNSSGMKRGLAVSAVSALTLVGLPLSASAQTVAQGEAGLELYSQYSGGATTRHDGANTTVTLFAGTPATIGFVTVNSVRFQYQSVSGAGAWVDIETVVAVNGVATTQWTPPANLADVAAVRAQALSNAGNVLATDDQTPTVVSNAAGVHAAHLDGALRSEVGIGPDNEIVVRGTTTDGQANTAVTARGPVEVPAAASTTTVGAPGTNGVSNFVSVVPVGANNTADANDEIIVGVAVTGSDDVNAYTAYKQNVTAANVNPSNGNVQGGGANEKSTYTITVTDQKGAPVQGVDIFESNAAGAPNAAGNGGTVDNNGNYVAGNGGETNVDGKFVAALQETDIDNATDGDANTSNNAQTTHYVVDVNQDGAYTNGTDYRFTVTQGRYATVPTTIEITSAKGGAIDDDETSQVTLLVKDQNGAPIQGVTPVVKVTRVNKDLPANDPNRTVVSDQVVGATGQDGKTSFNLTGLNDTWAEYTIDAFINNNGTPQPDAGDAVATPAKVVSNTSRVVWDSGDAAQALAGSTTTLTGKLVQDDTKAPLPGRTVAIDYTKEDNTVLAPQAQQPAGTTRGSDTTASATTGANGGFGVAVTDPATPAGQELDSIVRAQAPALESDNPLTWWPEDSTDAIISLDFLRSVTPVDVRIINDDTSNEQDGLYSPFADSPMPGSLGVGYVQAFNPDGIQLEDVDVQLTVEEGTFLDEENPFANPVVGGLAGDWNSAGKSVTVNTGDSGDGYFTVNIERHEGFDDDGEVDDKIHASVAGQTDEHDFTWTTNDSPLNQNEDKPFEVALSEDQESSILPKARAGDPDGSGQVVNYDVRAWDQFGNPTSQPINVSDNTPLADFDHSGESEFELDQPAIAAYADRAVSQELEVEFKDAQSFTYTDNPSNSEFDPKAPMDFMKFQRVELQETTDAINWYGLDFAASEFVLDHEGADKVPAGTQVTSTLSATDQEGQAIKGLPVSFVRVGPSEDGDSDGNGVQPTDREGMAYYDWAGNDAGIASVSAVVYDDNGVRQVKIGPDKITFSGDPKTDINLSVKAKNGPNDGKVKKDTIVVKADKVAAGATATLFRNGNEVRSHALNEMGDWVFTVRDTNGKKSTNYKIKVSGTASTFGATKSDSTK